MKRGLFILVVLLGGLYAVLHLVLGSQPVQKRVLDELRRELAKYGLDLDIESIEFSALTPKIYLNRVTLRARKGSPIPMTQPLAVDKIKIEFQPLALIYKKIVIEETVLFHPVIVHDSIDKLYHRIARIVEERKPSLPKKGARFDVAVKKFGVVDALVNVAAKEPPLAVRTQSITTFVTSLGTEQQGLTLETRNLQLDHGKFKTLVRRIELDVDMAKRGLRVNRALVDSDDLRVNVKGVAALPAKSSKELVQSLNASYEVKVALRALNALPEYEGPELAGTFESEGTATIASGAYGGSGQVRYDGISVDGYQVGSGHFSLSVEKRLATLTDFVARYAKGEVRARELQVQLHDKFAISGDATIRGVELDQILEAVKQYDTPIRMSTNGAMKVSGTLHPLEINGDLKNTIHNFLVYDDKGQGLTDTNRILSIKEGNIDGRLTFTEEKMAFRADLGILGGKASLDGYLTFDHYAKLKVKGDALSLTELRRIDEIELGGTTSLNAEIEVQGKDAKIGGTFDASNGEISQIVLGNVKGQAFYQNGLLAFENLETPSLDPVTGSGFVDFTPNPTHYKFQVEARRADVNRVFSAFQKQKLEFSVPQGGEIGARMTIEGGHDAKGIELGVSGQAKNFTWYGERWSSSTFTIGYRKNLLDLGRVVLLKKSGGIEVRGRFTEKSSTMGFLSHGLLLEELDHLGRAPIMGEVVGDVQLDMIPGGGIVSGRGEAKLSKTTFRGTAVPDSFVRIRPSDSGIEFLGNVGGEGLKGRLVRSKSSTKPGELLLYFVDFDFAPFVAILLGKDLTSLADLTATGDLSLTGDLADWRTLKGSGTVTKLNLGLKGTPMKNREPVQIRLDRGNLQFDRFVLVGPESQVAVEFAYRPEESVKGSLDGNLDLQFLQPFIPGLDYGSGKVTAGLRLSGHPSRYELIGNVTLDDGAFRLTGLTDEFRAVQAQISVSQDRLNLDRFEAQVNGGALVVEGDVRINKFQALIPNLRLSADRVMLKTGPSLASRFSGDFTIRGSETPYTLGGRCRILESTLSSFDTKEAPRAAGNDTPVLAFDVTCEARDKLYVKTDIMDSEMRGSFHIVGNSSKVGVLGNAEVISGSLLFRQTKFELGSGTVKFESASKIAPRFTISGRALVKEQKAANPVEYEISLQVFGTPEDYKIRLTSQPALAESDIIALLLLGITGRNQEGNYLDLGTAVVGQIPFQSKLSNELGVDIQLGSKPTSAAGQGGAGGVTPVTPVTPSATGSGTDVSVPSVRIQKGITKKTKLSYSSTLDASPIREYKIEQMLDDHFTVNATRVDNPHGASSSTTTSQNPSYGLDIRYRFQFE